jgi:hypothetical protein
MDVRTGQEAEGPGEPPGCGSGWVRNGLLRPWFDHYNAELFDNLLPRVRLVAADIKDDGLFFFSKRAIHINQSLDETRARAALVHEMLHLWQSCNGYRVWHGALFKREAARLAGLTGLHI